MRSTIQRCVDLSIFANIYLFMNRNLLVFTATLLLGACSHPGNNISNTPLTTTSQNTSPSQSSTDFSAHCGYTTTIGQGPYYVSGAPLLTDGNLNYTNLPGDTLILSGYVLEGIDNPTPIPHAQIDFWQADGLGDYHPLGSGSVNDYGEKEIALRGIVTTDDKGYYQVTSILPKEYSRRPRHMHVKVRVEGKPELTTQLYWQLDGDSNRVTASDVNPSSQPCQVLTPTLVDDAFLSTYNFYLR